MSPQKHAYKKIIESAYLGVLFVLPLIFNPWGFDSYEIPKNIFFGILTGLLVVGVLAHFLSQKENTFCLSSGQKRILAVLIFILGLSLLTSLRPEISFFGTYYRQGGVINALSYIGFFLVGLFYFEGPSSQVDQKVQKFFKTVLISGLLVALYGGLQKLGVDIYESSTTDVFAGRSFSSLGNPTSLGAFLLFPLGSAAYFFVTEKKERLLYGIAFLFLLAILVFSQSRGALLAVLACSGVLLLRQFKGNKTAIALLISTGLLALIGFATVFSSNTRSLSSRFTIWQSSVEILKESPLLGIGLENFSYAFEKHVQEDFFKYEDYRDLVDRPHNEFLEVWIHLGLPGLITMFFYLLFLLKNIWSSRAPEKVFANLILFALLIANFFGFSLVTQFGFMAAFLSMATWQRSEKIKWTWSPAKNVWAFGLIFLCLISIFFRVELFGVDRHMKKAYMATISGNAELASIELAEARRWGSMYGEILNKAFTFNLALAKTYQLDEYLQEAVYVNDLAIDLQGETLLNRLNRASLYEVAGNVEGAEAVYKKADEELAPNPVLFQNWAELYYREGRYGEALPLYEALLDLLPDWSTSADAKRIFWKNHPDFEEVLAHILATYEALGKVQEATDLEEKLK